MLSLLELTGSVRPMKDRPPSVAVPVLPLQVGLKLFQSVQPAPGARFPSASSNPLAFAIVPAAPQLTLASERLVAPDVLPKAGNTEALKSEEPEPELELECER